MPDRFVHRVVAGRWIDERRRSILRGVRRSSRTFSAFAISAYLASTFLPCEVPEGFRLAGSPGAIHAEPSSAQRPPTATDADTNHAHGHEHAEPGAGASSRPSPARDETRETRETSGLRLVFTAPCLCGCGDMRGTVGGGAARLGVAIPSVGVKPILAARVLQRSDAPLARFVSSVLEIEPIPI